MADVTARSFALTKLPPVCGGGVAVTCWLSLGWVCRGCPAYSGNLKG